MDLEALFPASTGSGYATVGAHAAEPDHHRTSNWTRSPSGNRSDPLLPRCGGLTPRFLHFVGSFMG